MTPATPSTAAPPTPATVSPQAGVVQLLNQYKPVVDKLLARTDLTAETFMAQIANAMRAAPDLWKCEPATILGAALRCAQLGLAPNDGNNLCWIIAYGNKATFQLGYGGAMELARRANPGLTFEGHAVAPNDLFELHRDETGVHYRHVPWYSRRGKIGSTAGGEPRLWYVAAAYPDGRRHVHVLTRDDVERHRSFSRQPNGQAWTKSYDAMALKSTILDMRRWLPNTPQLALAMSAEGQEIDIRDLDADDAELPPGDPYLDEEADR